MRRAKKKKKYNVSLSNFAESSEEDSRSGNLFGERKSAFLLIFPGQRIRDTRDNDVISLIQVASLIPRSLYRASYIGVYPWCLFYRGCTLP